MDAIARVPPGRWAVAVSGGADSIALLSLLTDRASVEPLLQLHVVHLDHQTRDGASAVDAQFVCDLALRWGLPVHVARRSDVEAMMPGRGAALPANTSARFRAARFEWFAQVVAREQLDGVILAHHADDQAETVLLRLLRGSGHAGLTGMSPDRRVAGVRVLRPLLDVPRSMLREHLGARGESWREDQSNASPRYARNRVRQFLAHRPELSAALCELAASCAALQQWVASNAPTLPEKFGVEQLASLPTILARHAARRWLRAHGVPADELSAEVCGRLLTMAADAASPARQEFSGRVVARRRGGVIWTEG